MNILYLSCHQVLEYDEVKLFHELGYDVFSTGSYAYPLYRPGMIRPGIPTLPHYPELERLASTILSSGGAIPDGLIDWADTIIFMHMPEVLEKNWAKLKSKRVIFRSIGQCVGHQEYLLSQMRQQGLQIVRYSPKEEKLPNYAGQDDLIRFYKDPEEFCDWTGQNRELLNFSQSLLQRRRECHYDEIIRLMSGFPGKIYGTGNENLGPTNGGQIEYDHMKRVMRESFIYIYGGTWPAPYTLSFIEAMMTGIPMICLGSKFAELDRGLDFYEIPQLITNGVDGFCSDNIVELRSNVEQLFNDIELAKGISKNARNKAIELFGKDTIAKQWKEFLNASN